MEPISLATMRYIDTGSRDPGHALGTWLSHELVQTAPIAALRIQTGYFGSSTLGYIEDHFRHLSEIDGHTRVLVGSNDGATPRADLTHLLTLAGNSRSNMRIGVVSHQTGLFHPKVFHITRADGSATAYVGSANLTASGATSLNVEAGIIIDSGEGDSQTVLDSIAGAIDAWFVESRPGLYRIVGDADLENLEESGVIARLAPPREEQDGQLCMAADPSNKALSRLKPLAAMPTIQTPLQPSPPNEPANEPSRQAPLHPASPLVVPARPTHGEVVKHWGKKLFPSDAQRKERGNQRGAITLVQGDYRGKIDQTIYFRNDLFGSAEWEESTDTTRQPIETALIPMQVVVNGDYHGKIDFKITHAPNRESAQNNYTTELHVEPLNALLRQTDLSGRHLDIELDNEGEYWLTID